MVLREARQSWGAGRGAEAGSGSGEKESGVGGLRWGAQDRRRRGLACVVAKRRRPGSPRGWEGRQTRGGCRETQDTPAPPPSTSPAGSSEKLGWQGLGATADMRRGGPGAQREGIGSQATRVSVPQCACCGIGRAGGEARTRRRWQERREAQEGAAAAALVGCALAAGGGGDRVPAGGMVGSVSTAPDPWLTAVWAGHSQSLSKWGRWTQGGLRRKLTATCVGTKTPQPPLRNAGAGQGLAAS